jgi:hypothetical protein
MLAISIVLQCDNRNMVALKLLAIHELTYALENCQWWKEHCLAGLQFQQMGICHKFSGTAGTSH